MSWARAALCVTIAALAGACLRAPIGDEAWIDTEAAEAASETAGAPDGPGMSGPIPAADADGDSTTGPANADPACHPSYVPCLPVVDDLDCDEVRALDAAPVEVIGDDAYGLDADDDGIGCES